ncbi:MAG: hypothetical protein Q9169_006663 [Polycauliona sp. 2 TL-2023]
MKDGSVIARRSPESPSRPTATHNCSPIHIELLSHSATLQCRSHLDYTVTEMSTFQGFRGGDTDPPPQPKRDDSEDDKLTEEELLAKYHLSDEQRTELRHRLKTEWTPKFLGKKYVKNATDDPDTFSNIDLPTTTRYRLNLAGGVYFKNHHADSYLDTSSIRNTAGLEAREGA